MLDFRRTIRCLTADTEIPTENIDWMFPSFPVRFLEANKQPTVRKSLNPFFQETLVGELSRSLSAGLARPDERRTRSPEQSIHDISGSRAVESDSTAIMGADFRKRWSRICVTWCYIENFRHASSLEVASTVGADLGLCVQFLFAGHFLISPRAEWIMDDQHNCSISLSHVVRGIIYEFLRLQEPSLFVGKASGRAAEIFSSMYGRHFELLEENVSGVVPLPSRITMWKETWNKLLRETLRFRDFNSSRSKVCC